MGPTFMQELDAEREVALAGAEKVVRVGTGKMAVRFKPPSDPDVRDQLTGVVAVYRSGSALTAAQEKQLIIDCCDEIGLYRNGEVITIEGGEGPLRFDASDPRWEGKCDNAHDCVAKLYNLDVQPLACAGLADALIDWLQGLDSVIRARVEGKSEAPPASSS